MDKYGKFGCFIDFSLRFSVYLINEKISNDEDDMKEI